MKRRPFTILSALSLLLFAAGLLHCASGYIPEFNLDVEWKLSSGGVAARSRAGALRLERVSGYRSISEYTEFDHQLTSETTATGRFLTFPTKVRTLTYVWKPYAGQATPARVAAAAAKPPYTVQWRWIDVPYALLLASAAVLPSAWIVGWWNGRRRANRQRG